MAVIFHLCFEESTLFNCFLDYLIQLSSFFNVHTVFIWFLIHPSLHVVLYYSIYCYKFVTFYISCQSQPIVLVIYISLFQFYMLSNSLADLFMLFLQFVSNHTSFICFKIIYIYLQFHQLSIFHAVLFAQHFHAGTYIHMDMTMSIIYCFTKNYHDSYCFHDVYLQLSWVLNGRLWQACPKNLLIFKLG